MAQTTKEKNKLCQIFWGKKEKQPLFKFQRLNVFKRRFPSSIPKHVKINKRRQKHHSIKKWHNIQTLHKTLTHFIIKYLVGETLWRVERRWDTKLIDFHILNYSVWHVPWNQWLLIAYIISTILYVCRIRKGKFIHWSLRQKIPTNPTFKGL